MPLAALQWRSCALVSRNTERRGQYPHDLERNIVCANAKAELAGTHGFSGYKAGTVLLTPGSHAVEIEYIQVHPNPNPVHSCRALQRSLAGVRALHGVIKVASWCRFKTLVAHRV